MWPGERRHVVARLESFIADRARAYAAARDYPADPGTSAVSPYLALGQLSIGECLRAAVVANPGASPLDAGEAGITTWISELIWREFYIHVMAAFPRVCMGRAFRPETERIAWNDRPDHLRAWATGMTGIPIVDAGMRQLLAEGWMHNRVRMVTAMFLSKNLLLDWRLGEQHFMRHLVDGFLASNNGGWQWSASTGTDAAPYFRIFNPVSQGRRFDPEGAYVRKYVPELCTLDASVIHEPWTIPPLVRPRVGYPDPIVDLGKTREAAIQAFSRAIGRPDPARGD